MPTSIYHLRITLRDIKPAIWRRVAVPSDLTLGELHEIVQIAMGWCDCHLHQFMLNDKTLKKSREEIARMARHAEPDDIFEACRGIRMYVPKLTPFGEETEMEGIDEDSVDLAEVFQNVKSKLIYQYDFGDGWEHTIEVQKVTEPKTGETYPLCVSGKRACPPEDCGGPWGYAELIEAIADPEHERHEELREWLDDEFDPDAFDIEEVNDILAEWREARNKRRPRLRLAK